VSPSLSWLDLTAADRDKVRRVLDLFSEQGTVDELGIGSLRDTISNALFPGTSVLHTRMRYVMFIPWIYRELESWGTGYDVAHHARELEIQLIDALAESDDTAGVIGIDAGANLARLASNAYWALLVHWGLFMPARPQSWYHRNFDELLSRRANVESEGSGLVSCIALDGKAPAVRRIRSYRRGNWRLASSVFRGPGLVFLHLH